MAHAFCSLAIVKKACHRARQADFP